MANTTSNSAQDSRGNRSSRNKQGSRDNPASRRATSTQEKQSAPQSHPITPADATPVDPSSFKTAFWQSFWEKRAAASAKKIKLSPYSPDANSPHRSFHRSYREDYDRPLSAPSLWQHAFSTLKVLLANWKLFAALLVFTMFLCFALVGVMSEKTYTEFQSMLENTSHGELGKFATSGLLFLSAIASGGFTGSFSENQIAFMILIFLIVWLVTIYLLRRLATGERPRLRDGLFNALSPLLSTIIIALVICFDLLPIGGFIVTLSAAIKTNLLSTPFYALIFAGFAFLMILLSLFLLSRSLIALIAVSAPGMYPLVALYTAGQLVSGRRLRIMARVVFGAFLIALTACLIMIPLIFIDLSLKSAFDWLDGFPFIPACLLTLISAIFIYVPSYLYLYYRSLLEND